MPRYHRAPLSNANTVNNNSYGSGYRLPCTRRGSGTSVNAARRLANATMAPSPSRPVKVPVIDSDFSAPG